MSMASEEVVKSLRTYAATVPQLLTPASITHDFILPVLSEILGHGSDNEMALYGKDGALDSIGLLSLVVLLEEKINVATGKTIRLVSDGAFSQTRSPFRDVASLAEYVAVLLCAPSTGLS